MLTSNGRILQTQHTCIQSFSPVPWSFWNCTILYVQQPRWVEINVKHESSHRHEPSAWLGCGKASDWGKNWPSNPPRRTLTEETEGTGGCQAHSLSSQWRAPSVCRLLLSAFETAWAGALEAGNEGRMKTRLTPAIAKRRFARRAADLCGRTHRLPFPLLPPSSPPPAFRFCRRFFLPSTLLFFLPVFSPSLLALPLPCPSRTAHCRLACRCSSVHLRWRDRARWRCDASSSGGHARGDRHHAQRLLPPFSLSRTHTHPRNKKNHMYTNCY